MFVLVQNVDCRNEIIFFIHNYISIDDYKHMTRWKTWGTKFFVIME